MEFQLYPENRPYYVYRHIRKDSETPFYIGLGKKRKDRHTPSSEYERAHQRKERSEFWHNIVNKYGYTVEIMIEDLTYEEAVEKEQEMIALYGRIKDGGLLCNLTAGGEGNKDYVTSEYTKKLLREVNLIPVEKNVEDNSFPCPITGCTHWVGGGTTSERKNKAYINFDGKSYPAQKFLYEYYNNVKLKKGQFVVTTCGNRFCVNKDHFTIGTYVMPLKKGEARKFKHHRQVLTEELVLEIRRLKKEENLGPTEIAKRLGGGISRDSIGFVLRGKSWGWLK